VSCTKKNLATLDSCRCTLKVGQQKGRKSTTGKAAQVNHRKSGTSQPPEKRHKCLPQCIDAFCIKPLNPYKSNAGNDGLILYMFSPKKWYYQVRHYLEFINQIADLVTLTLVQRICSLGRKKFATLVRSRVARWFLFKPKIQIWANFWRALDVKMLIYFTDIWDIL
jgi:hypothetical protein